MSITLTLFAQILAFVILIWLVNKFMWAPLSTMMEERRTKIADGLAASERGQQALEEAQAEVNKAVDEAKVQAQEIVNSARVRETQIIEEAKANAIAEADRIKAAAEAEIEQEVNRAKEALRGQVTELAVAGAERILKREVSAEAHNDALSDLVAQI